MMALSAGLRGLLFGALTACLLSPAIAQTPPLDDSSSEMRPLIERYSADYASLVRTYPIEISARRQARLRELIAENQAALRAANFNSFGQDGKIDYVLFRHHLDAQLSSLNLERQRVEEIARLLPFTQTIVDLEESRRKMEPIDPQQVAERLAALAKEIHAAEEASRSVGAQRTVVNRAARRLDELRETMRLWFSFYNGYDPLFTWWAEIPYTETANALASYANYLRDSVLGLKQNDPSGGEIIGDPVGRDALIDNLRSNMIPYTPEELIQLAEKEYAWSEQEMLRASREMGFGDDWRAALEEVKSRYVEPGEQPELVRRLAEEAIDFVVERDLVTVPDLAREDWWEEMLSPERQLTSPFFLGGDIILVAFPTNTMTHEQKLNTMRGNNEHFSRSVVFHELIPGHHLQGFMSERFRQYRSIFATPFWSEGNAFYWELLLWDLDFPRGPEDRIGMLFWRMHRAARIIFSLSFHLERMTAEECVDLLVERVGFERFNAEAEVRRSVNGDYEPIYQSAYMLGALQFYALHKELVDSGRMSNREFHDALLRENSIPIEMIRADLIGQELTRDFETSWRFYDLGEE